MTTDLSPAVVEALAIGSLPDVQWSNGDDLCDCTYQRIGMWTNPYLAITHELRFCCAWAKLYEMFPETARTISAFWDYNNHVWVTEPAEWNGELDMPPALWHRQLARQRGITIAEARALELPAPKGKPRKAKPHLFLKAGGEWCELELT